MNENTYVEFLEELKKIEPKYFTDGGVPLKNHIIENDHKLDIDTQRKIF